jgi:microcystin-dependent protein
MAQGQLWYGTQAGGDDVRIVRVNNDGTSQTTVAGASINAAGSSQPHDNIQPTLVVNYIISLFGIYPTPS